MRVYIVKTTAKKYPKMAQAAGKTTAAPASTHPVFRSTRAKLEALLKKRSDAQIRKALTDYYVDLLDDSPGELAEEKAALKKADRKALLQNLFGSVDIAEDIWGILSSLGVKSSAGKTAASPQNGWASKEEANADYQEFMKIVKAKNKPLFDLIVASVPAYDQPPFSRNQIESKSKKRETHFELKRLAGNGPAATYEAVFTVPSVDFSYEGRDKDIKKAAINLLKEVKSLTPRTVKGLENSNAGDDLAVVYGLKILKKIGK